MYEGIKFEFEGTEDQGVEIDLSKSIGREDFEPYDSDDLPWSDDEVVETTSHEENLVPMPGIEKLAELKEEFAEEAPAEVPEEDPAEDPAELRHWNVTVITKNEGTSAYNIRLDAVSKEAAVEKVRTENGIDEIAFSSVIEVITADKAVDTEERTETQTEVQTECQTVEQDDEQDDEQTSEQTEEKELPPPVVFEDGFSKLQGKDLSDKEKSILYMLNEFHISPDLLNALLNSDFSESWKQISELNKTNLAVQEKLTKELGDKRDDRVKVLRYLVEKARDPEFAKQILLEHKDFNRCYKYVTDKVTESFGRKGEVIQISDDTVYSWAVDYYMLDDYAEVMEERRKEEEKKAKAKAKADAKKKKEEKKAEKEKFAAEKKAKAEAEKQAKAEERARKAEEKAKAEEEKKAAEAPKPIDECHVEESNGQISFIF